LPSSGSWTLTRSPGGTTYSGTGTSYTVTGLPAGTFTFTVTNASGCTSGSSSGKTITASPDSPITPTVGTIVQPSCLVATGSVELGSLPSSGSWTVTKYPGGTTVTGSVTSVTISGLAAATTYRFTVTNAAGCTSPESNNVVINTTPSVPARPTIGTTTNPGCTVATGSAQLAGLPPAETWTLTIYPDTINIIGTGADTTIANLAAGDYIFKVTNASGCSSPVTDTVTIIKQPVTPATPIVGTIIQPTCSEATGSVELTGLPSGTWVLTGTLGDIDTTGTGTGSSIVIPYLPTGTYTFAVSDSTGCISVASSNVVIDEQPATPATPTITQDVNALHSDATSGNQWYNLNGLINGETNQVYNATSNGDYFVIVTLGECSSISSDTIHFIHTGIDQAAFGKILNLYPNPVSNVLFIETKGDAKETNVEIVNSLGQVVYKGYFVEKTAIRTSGYAPGVYLIKLERDNTYEFRKIVKK
jgi:hypothetical protein